MFLTMLQKRNPKLVNTIFKMHQQGLIAPDSIVLDLETIKQNARLLAQKAIDYHLKPFFITKQIGFNPLVAKAIIEAGFKGVVCVDFKEAMMCMRHQLPIAHVGHLVQIPEAMIAKILNYGVDFFTIYSIEKAQKINAIAAKLDKKQAILIKLIEDNGTIYKGQEGGFSLAQLPALIDKLKTMAQINIAGLTAFPCWLYDPKLKKIAATKNVELILKAKKLLAEHNIFVSELNMPSANAWSSIADLANIGATHLEAGHSLTGTTPMHAYHDDLAEIPAMAYISEISHHYQKDSYFYGGGCYRRYPIHQALIGTSSNNCTSVDVNEFDATSIDYHLSTPHYFPIGASVIACFRTQVFVTRSEVLVIDQIQSDNPVIIGTFSPLGDVR